MSKQATVELPEELVRFADGEVAAGRFADLGEVLSAGVETLREQAEDAEGLPAPVADEAGFIAAVQEGLEQMERGEVLTHAEFTARLEAKLAAVERRASQ